MRDANEGTYRGGGGTTPVIMGLSGKSLREKLLLLQQFLEPQSRFGDEPFKSQVVCPQNGTAVLKAGK